MMVDALGDDVEMDEIHGTLVMVDEPLHLFRTPTHTDGAHTLGRALDGFAYDVEMGHTLGWSPCC